jgi:F-type H+-transporting ATPase subunit a
VVSIYEPLEHALHIPQVVQATVLAVALLLVSGLVIRRQIAAAGGGVLPDEGVTLRNVVEVMVGGLANLARDVMGEDWRHYFPLVGAIFVFILVSNLLGLLPGFGGATSDVNTTTAWAVISFCAYNYVGIRKHGVLYINQFMGPALMNLKIAGRTFHFRPLFWFFLPLEIFLHLARIGTLSVRLLANMFADHTVVAVWLTLVPIAIPAVFMALGTLVAVLQAVVFSLLTMIYIGLAQEEAH